MGGSKGSGRVSTWSLCPSEAPAPLHSVAQENVETWHRGGPAAAWASAATRKLGCEHFLSKTCSCNLLNFACPQPPAGSAHGAGGAAEDVQQGRARDVADVETWTYCWASTLVQASFERFRHVGAPACTC